MSRHKKRGHFFRMVASAAAGETNNLHHEEEINVFLDIDAYSFL